MLRAFCPGISDDGVPSQASKHAEATSPCFLLLLEKENGAHNAASLIESCMIQLTLKGLMGKLTCICYDNDKRQQVIQYFGFIRIHDGSFFVVSY